MKTMVITGANRGIGLALTKIFADNDYRILATYRDETSAKELIDLSKKNPSVVVTNADVATDKGLGALKYELRELQGSIDILINNAGIMGESAKSLKDLDIEKVAETINVNSLGAMRVTKLALPYLKAGSKIAHVSSLMGSVSDNQSGGYYDYRMSKTALNMFNKSLSKELPEMICLVLHPGWVQTDMGGKNAPVAVSESAQGLYQVITNAKLEQTGHFIDFKGKDLSW
jgi:NAD(P)-dependent dehydrogenase (short-subunit alcohol dehydrogenase family)